MGREWVLGCGYMIMDYWVDGLKDLDLEKVGRNWVINNNNSQ